MSLLVEAVGGGQTSGTRAHNGHVHAGAVGGDTGHYPPLVPSAVDDRVFDVLDRNGRVDQARDACALTGSRAHPPRELWEVVGLSSTTAGEAGEAGDVRYYRRGRGAKGGEHTAVFGGLAMHKIATGERFAGLDLTKQIVSKTFLWTVAYSVVEVCGNRDETGHTAVVGPKSVPRAVALLYVNVLTFGHNYSAPSRANDSEIARDIEGR